MRKSLKRHPSAPCEAVTRIDVEIARPRADRLRLSYAVTGNMRDLCLPAATAPTRCDGLWQHTCFEAFIRAPSGRAYYEFNFAPSLQWAAYRFSGYRSGMRVANEIGRPRIEIRSDETHYELQTALALGRLSDLPSDAAWELGVSAVIEETSGRKSYWALEHPPGKADFHHSDCFAYELAAAWRS